MIKNKRTKMGMFYNGANCDIYIGRGAGKKLLNDIKNAKQSITIVSPYLSPFLISELIELHNKNLKIELITVDNIKDEETQENLKKLIIQNQETNIEAVKQKDKWKTITKKLTLLGRSFLLILIGVAYYTRDYKTAFGIIPIIVLYILVKIYKHKIKFKRIYSYKYTQLFPFKVYIAPNLYAKKIVGIYIHSKIYLIDKTIAYLGSLNYTSSGTKFNYETRVRTEEPNAIKKIEEELYKLMYQSQLPEKDIQAWGRQLYKEPIN